MSQEDDDLSTHVSLCHLRYQQLQEKIDVLEQRLTKMENNILSLKNEIQSGFADIALKIEKENNRRSIQIIASAGSVVVAILGALGVWLANRG
jgi:predicted  nucleic acid-binding Zn-ribbon protein